MNVAENLYEYLKHKDLAEIPGLGTFKVKVSPARISEATLSIIPPSRKVCFDKTQENNNDFVSFMAQTEFISQETAYTWIKQYSDSLIEKLEQGRSVTIGKLGSFKKGYVGEYVFTAEQDLNLMDDSFALNELKNVKVYENEESEIGLIHTKPEVVTAQEPEAVEDLSEKQETQKPDSDESLADEDRIKETQEQTEERIIKHEQIETQSETKEPVNVGEKTEGLGFEETSFKESETKEKTEEPEEKEEEQEEVKPQEPIKEEEKEQESIDDLQKQANDILSKYGIDNTKERKKKKAKRFWFVLFWIVLVLVLLCAAFVGAHYMGWLKDIKALKPITEKLAYYVPVRTCQKVASPVTPTATVSSNEQPEEVSPTVVLEQEVLNPQSVNTQTQRKRPIAKAPAKKTQKTEPQPEQKPVVKDNSPVLVQTYSKLGFDVVGATSNNKSTAETLARKAKSLGYDGYVLSKIKNGSPIYYVSYGSRRTLKEANDLMQGMITKMGGSYYVISR